MERAGWSAVEWHLLVVALLANDILMAGLGFRLAYWLRFETAFPFFRADVFASQLYYQGIAMILVPIWIVVFTLMGLYRREVLLGGTQEYRRVFRATTYGLVAVFFVEFLKPETIVARGWVLLGWPLVFLLTVLGRMALRRLVYAMRRRGHFLSRTLVVGANREAVLMANQLRQWTTSGLAVLGLIGADTETTPDLSPGLRVLGDLEHLDGIIGRYGVTDLVLASSSMSRETMLDLFRRYGTAEGISLRLSSGLYEIITTGLNVREFGFVPLVGVNRVRLTGTDRVAKWVLDLSITIPGLIVLSPLLLTIAVLVKLDSRGPLIHRRRVMGTNGRQFDAFKFRTMLANADEVLAATPELAEEFKQHGKIKDDPRVTRVGKFLRRWSLDELPQLFNVVRREMSLVGPRMISPEEMERYAEWGINLLTVQPGITGIWQVSGRSDISYEERVRLDMYYIRNWNIWLDLQLLWQTIPAVLKGRGAY
jgi:exopolysaccharide biosynthesis polyprenyl glycosylphosphotransferase